MTFRLVLVKWPSTLMQMPFTFILLVSPIWTLFSMEKAFVPIGQKTFKIERNC